VKIERLGEVSYSTYGGKMTISEYTSTIDMTVEFEDGYTTKTIYSNFKRGVVKNPYEKTVLGIGYLGQGEYKGCEINNQSKQYSTWRSMLRRCYSVNAHEKQPTYINCTVIEEWHNFQVFAKWYDENIYTIRDEKLQLDKDILFKGNKIYSPDTCVFTPQRINLLFIKREAKRGIYPIGVLSHSNNRFRAHCNNTEKVTIELGLFNTIREAFTAYKNYKENTIKEMADKYKISIPKKLYDALYNYKVEITD